MALDPLKNPLERFTSLPTSVSLRKNPADNSPFWDPTIQYYANDLVLSAVDGGAHVMSGIGNTLAESETVVRGGDDPSVAGGNWISLVPDGVGRANWNAGTTPFTMTPAAANVITVAGGALVRSAVPAGLSEVWAVQLNFTAGQSAVGGFVSGDAITATFTPTVAGTAVGVVCIPRFSSATSGLSASAVVTLPATSTGATLVASWQGVQPTSISANPTIIWTRIA